MAAAIEAGRRSGDSLRSRLLALAARALPQPGLPMDDPAAFARASTLGDRLDEAQARGQPVHIAYVHGIRAYGPGVAQVFMRGLVRYGDLQGPPVGADGLFERAERFRTDLGPRPTADSVVGRPVFPCDVAWRRSQPFVDRYLFRRGGQVLAVLDEVNWWPLLFPFKCSFLVGPDAGLSGPDRPGLAACMRDDDLYFPWLTPADAQAAAKKLKISGGSAKANAFVKQALFIWGLADAVVAIGDVSALLHAAMDQVFAYAARYEDRDVTRQAFAVVAESLGAFVVLDAAAAGGETARVTDSAEDLWLFANQFPLLELARVTPAPGPVATNAVGAADLPPGRKGLLHRWAAAPRRTADAEPRPRQVLAFSDPSDALTYLVPPLPGAPGEPAPIVVNIFDRNEFDWFHLIADPLSAHGGHSRNPAVLRLMLTPRARH
jgi:hypothetical protein